MEKVLDLIEQKNNCLVRFKDMNEQEIHNFNEGNFDNLETFYHSRETILEMIGRLDNKITQEQHANEQALSVSNESKSRLKQALELKNSLVQDIIELDLMIISIIEQAKSQIIKDLSQVKAVKKVFGTANKKTGSRIDENF